MILEPEEAGTTWSGPEAVEALSAKAWRVGWPAPDAPVLLHDRDGAAVLRLPLAQPVGAVLKRL